MLRVELIKGNTRHKPAFDEQCFPVISVSAAPASTWKRWGACPSLKEALGLEGSLCNKELSGERALLELRDVCLEQAPVLWTCGSSDIYCVFKFLKKEIV